METWYYEVVSIDGDYANLKINAEMSGTYYTEEDLK